MTDSNTNYWGGEPDASMWFEQEAMTFKTDRDIKITLAIRANTGDIGFGPYSELGEFIGSDPLLGHGEYSWDQPIPLVLPTDAASSTLKVTEKGGLFRVDTFDPESPDRVHSVVFTFHTPKVERTSPAIISGFRHRRPGWGSWVTRMIIIEP